MKIDYLLFGDLLVLDTTYRTNKFYNDVYPICSYEPPYKYFMVGCGFFINEKVKSFIWLFNTFLRSMDGIALKTIMTNQAFSMANADCRLCGWHIQEISRCHINHFKMVPSFPTKFDCILFRFDIIFEFEQCWLR